MFHVKLLFIKFHVKHFEWRKSVTYVSDEIETIQKYDLHFLDDIFLNWSFLEKLNNITGWLNLFADAIKLTTSDLLFSFSIFIVFDQLSVIRNPFKKECLVRLIMIFWSNHNETNTTIFIWSSFWSEGHCVEKNHCLDLTIVIAKYKINIVRCIVTLFFTFTIQTQNHPNCFWDTLWFFIRNIQRLLSSVYWLCFDVCRVDRIYSETTRCIYIRPIFTRSHIQKISSSYV